MAIIEHELVIGGDDQPLPCAVEGCPREGKQQCEMCGEVVCQQHSTLNVAAEMILCFSCHIGMGEGMGAALKGVWW